MKAMHLLLLATVSLALACGCNQETPPPHLTDIPVPCKAGGEPRLFIANDGTALLSWVEYLDDTTDALVFSHLESGQWSEPHTVATGSNWFVNWADFPSIATFLDNPQAMAAHWLQMSADGTYDYDIRVSISTNHGRQWSQPFILHDDGVHAEHGFVSLVPLSADRMFAVWLDGRHMASGSHGHGEGAMTLHCATFDTTGHVFDEKELDDKVCECCTTAALRTPSGILVAYRNRSDQEVRDIYTIRLHAGEAEPARPVHDDGWQITACPVNGPALAGKASAVAIAWFTAAGAEPRVMAAFSTDEGASFGPPVRIDGGNALGRVDIVMPDQHSAVICWLEAVDGKAEIRVRRAYADGRLDASQTVATTSASRSSGFPQMGLYDEQLLIAWTEVDSAGNTRVRSGFFPLPK